MEKTRAKAAAKTTAEVKALIVVPTSYRSEDTRIASALTDFVRKLGCDICHTSAPEMRFESIEERHQDRIRTALKNGITVYAFGVNSELESMGCVMMGGLKNDPIKRLKAALQA